MRWFILLCLALLVALVPAWSTNTYTDYRKTGGGNTGADTTNAWLTIVAAVQAAHSGGDTIWVHPAHIETLGEIADVESDGTAAAPIVLKVDVDADVWPATTTTVAITCGANYLYWLRDDYWHVDHLRCSLFSLYGMRIYLSDGVKITNCTFDQPVAAGDYGIYITQCVPVIEDCVFDGNTIGNDGNNLGRGIMSTAGAYVNSCTFDGQYTGIEGAGVYANNCDFGKIEPNTTDITASVAASFVAVLSGYLSSNSLLSAGSDGPLVGHVARFYADASNRPMVYRESYAWNSITDYTTVHSGGADYSLKVMTNVAAAGLNAPIKVAELAVHADSLETRDYTLSARRDTNWGTAPTAAQFYLEATYIATSVSTATVVSTQTLTNTNTWYDLTAANVTPNHDGPVMLTLWLKTTDTNGAIYVDPRLTATGETYHETFLWGLPDLAYFYTAPAGGSQVIILN